VRLFWWKRLPERKTDSIAGFDQEAVIALGLDLGGGHHAGEFVEGDCLREWPSSVAVVPKDRDRNLVHLLDISPNATVRSPALASAALLRAGLVCDCSASFGEHRFFVGDTVFKMIDPTNIMPNPAGIRVQCNG
jgi:hypothetical protein